MRKKSYIYIIMATFLAYVVVCCTPKALPEPKPMGYFRIDLPEHQYHRVDTTLPFTFEQSTFATTTIESRPNNSLWIDVTYPKLGASFRFTCFEVKNADSLRKLMVAEDKMVKFHYQKADDVQYSVVRDPEAHIWGQTYEIYGKQVATPFQFWLTDSVHHFVRATLYFDFAPNNDSLQPVIDYLKEDAMHLINSFAWKP
jgi:gliding motility-associated lipoprotein GldD